MSSILFEKVLHLKCQTSRWLISILVLLHVTAIISVIVSVTENQLLRWSLLLLVILSFSYYFNKLVLLGHPHSVLAVTQTRQGDWSLQLANGQLVEAELCGDSYQHPLLVVLNFKTSLGGLNVVLFPDALKQDQHRQLRCRLRLLKH